MANHVSATAREPHANQTTRTATIMNALKQRALAALNDNSIDPQSRATLRSAMEIHDPWLAELVRRAETHEPIVETQKPETNQVGSSREKIEALAEIICGAGEQSAGALLVLMRALENSTHPEVLAHTAKHFAFTRCGELNVFGLVDAQIAVVESKLLAGTTLAS